MKKLKKKLFFSSVAILPASLPLMTMSALTKAENKKYLTRFDKVVSIKGIRAFWNNDKGFVRFNSKKIEAAGVTDFSYKIFDNKNNEVNNHKIKSGNIIEYKFKYKDSWYKERRVLSYRNWIFKDFSLPDSNSIATLELQHKKHVRVKGIQAFGIDGKGYVNFNREKIVASGVTYFSYKIFDNKGNEVYNYEIKNGHNIEYEFEYEGFWYKGIHKVKLLVSHSARSIAFNLKSTLELVHKKIVLIHGIRAFGFDGQGYVNFNVDKLKAIGVSNFTYKIYDKNDNEVENNKIKNGDVINYKFLYEEFWYKGSRKIRFLVSSFEDFFFYEANTTLELKHKKNVVMKGIRAFGADGEGYVKFNDKLLKNKGVYGFSYKIYDKNNNEVINYKIKNGDVIKYKFFYEKFWYEANHEVKFLLNKNKDLPSKNQESILEIINILEAKIGGIRAFGVDGQGYINFDTKDLRKWKITDVEYKVYNKNNKQVYDFEIKNGDRIEYRLKFNGIWTKPRNHIVSSLSSPKNFFKEYNVELLKYINEGESNRKFESRGDSIDALSENIKITFIRDVSDNGDKLYKVSFLEKYKYKRYGYESINMNKGDFFYVLVSKHNNYVEKAPIVMKKSSSGHGFSGVLLGGRSLDKEKFDIRIRLDLNNHFYSAFKPKQILNLLSTFIRNTRNVSSIRTTTSINRKVVRKVGYHGSSHFGEWESFKDLGRESISLSKDWDLWMLPNRNVRRYRETLMEINTNEPFLNEPEQYLRFVNLLNWSNKTMNTWNYFENSKATLIQLAMIFFSESKLIQIFKGNSIFWTSNDYKEGREIFKKRIKIIKNLFSKGGSLFGRVNLRNIKNLIKNRKIHKIKKTPLITKWVNANYSTNSFTSDEINKLFQELGWWIANTQNGIKAKRHIEIILSSKINQEIWRLKNKIRNLWGIINLRDLYKPLSYKSSEEIEMDMSTTIKSMPYAHYNFGTYMRYNLKDSKFLVIGTRTKITLGSSLLIDKKDEASKLTINLN